MYIQKHVSFLIFCVLSSSHLCTSASEAAPTFTRCKTRVLPGHLAATRPLCPQLPLCGLCIVSSRYDSFCYHPAAAWVVRNHAMVPRLASPLNTANLCRPFPSVIFDPRLAASLNLVCRVF